ncbi:tetratricopeptide repeat protein [Streptomyces rhizosphaericus]|uniref:tetratricopeptide repeat protein n=1 Tax=Streptomyces rhizosphaericus TaxID=114699 RepID=UPI00117C6E93|nr:tetratricopeptide repeat protein [Streptomyces rhizosphaericus]
MADAARDQRVQAQILYELGSTQYAMGRADDAKGFLIRAHRMRANLGDGEIRSPRWIARTLEMPGQTAEEQGHASLASRFYKTSLEQYELINLRDAERVRQRLRELAEQVNRSSTLTLLREAGSPGLHHIRLAFSLGRSIEECRQASSEKKFTPRGYFALGSNCGVVVAFHSRNHSEGSA